MGALHEGHAALIRHAAAHARQQALGQVIVSVFVNPKQFTDPADLARYPATLEADVKLCEDAGAACVYAPDVNQVYPTQDPSRLPAQIDNQPRSPRPDHRAEQHNIPALPSQATQPGLDDTFRPGHFAGVCQVVRRLFDLVMPAAAVFGEKDWQQLQVVTSLCAMDGRATVIVPSPTVRESSGLAMSSRNRFLSPVEHTTIALAIFRALQACQTAESPDAAEKVMHQVLNESGISPQYAVVRKAQSLMPFPEPHKSRAKLDDPPARALIAAIVGSVRLIDNTPWGG